MKIRMGFVSNSSSSSFLVFLKDDSIFGPPKEFTLTDEENIKKLEEYGFKYSNTISPFKIIFHNKEEDEEYTSMKYFVVCNQDEVISFLVKNNIPFKSSCQYDQEFISYQKDSDYILKAENFGMSLDMYGEDDDKLERVKDIPRYEKWDVKEYLEENKI